jgi:hypothetical protein
MLALLEADPSINWLQATPACWRMLAWLGGAIPSPPCAVARRWTQVWPSSSVPAPGGCGTATGRPRPPSGPGERGALATGWRADHHQPQPARLSALGAGRGGAAGGRGECGELCIESPALCEGYWRKPALTSAAFLRLATHRLYRTGDRVRLIGADRFLYLGRRDDQIKLRGFRIELGEVEAGLRRQAGVQEAAVRLVGEGDEAMLVGYVEAKSGVSSIASPCARGCRRRCRTTWCRRGSSCWMPCPRPAAASSTERRCHCPSRRPCRAMDKKKPASCGLLVGRQPRGD